MLNMQFAKFRTRLITSMKCGTKTKTKYTKCKMREIYQQSATDCSEPISK